MPRCAAPPERVAPAYAGAEHAPAAKEQACASAAPRHGLTGVVLAGGRSSRLGRDKAALRLGCADNADSPDSPDSAGAPDLLERAVSLLRGLCDKVLIAGSCRPDLPHVPDAAPGLGPAGGIAAALQATGGPCLVLACDLPFMDAATLARLLEVRASRPEGTLLTAYREPESGRVQSLVAVYESGCLPFLTAGREGRMPPLHALLPADRSYFLPYARRDSLAFFNLNSPRDLAAALEIMRRRSCGRAAKAGRKAPFPARPSLPVDGSASR